MKKLVIGTIAAIALAAPPAFADHHEEAPEMKPVPAGPEAKMLEDWAGKWDAAVKMWMGPEAQESKGTQTCRMILGGIALACDYDSSDGPMPMKGHGVTIWNPTAKRYDGVWLDNYSWAGPSTSTGTWDAGTKTFTETMTSDMPDGTKHTMRLVTKVDTRDKHTMTFYGKGPDGKEARMMEIVYTRAK